MDLWIRSQDKESLTKISNIQYTHEKGNLYTDVNEKHHIGTYYDNLKILGTYKTKERALEVLGDIHRYINNDCKQYINTGDYYTSEHRYSVYEMPID